MARVEPYTEGGQPGAGYLFDCPGCGSMHAVPVGEGAGPRWDWNGSIELPTFTPSLLVTHNQSEPPVTPENLAEWKRAPWPQTKVKHVCHSFIVDGRIQFLDDCTHALAGQTVDLAECETDG